MKKLYYRCSETLNDALTVEAERQHITKNQVMDDIIREHFDIQKAAKSYRKYSNAEARILTEMVAIGADIQDIREILETLRVERIYDEKLRNICMDIGRNLISIEQKLRTIDARIRQTKNSTSRKQHHENPPD